MQLMPTMGAVVTLRDAPGQHVGRVIQLAKDNTSTVKVSWPQARSRQWHSIDDLEGALQPGHHVIHVPDGLTQSSLGLGVVISQREVAGYRQYLLDFQEADSRRWIPWQHLKLVPDVPESLAVSRFEQKYELAPERLRLRILAWALKLWNENTGSLAQFDINPLPHQIQLVHHLLQHSYNINWLIADDVGLGKTIELGLLLAALRQRGRAKRVLLITPAGLTGQWKDAMKGKFGIDDFRIYGRDFEINDDPREWKMYDAVIASMDRLKHESHRDLIMQADPWDLIVVDEAHRLTRQENGNKYHYSQRYQLLRILRRKTDSLVLLTATPHQGRDDSFRGLLELLHPERRSEINTLDANPEILSEMVFRNNKANVTDMEGNFLFHGTTVRQIEVDTSPALIAFDLALQRYIRQGYAAGNADGTYIGRAIGFVMTVYRKLAASSVTAIHQALIRRQGRLLKAREEQASIRKVWADLKIQDEDDSIDERFIGEIEEQLAAQVPAKAFFQGELDTLEELIMQAQSLLQADPKLEAFLNGIVTQVSQYGEQEKLLVFTEYRSTQACLRDSLEARFGSGCCALIHGGMNVDERKAAIHFFEEDIDVRFLVSTEAGGEGINLHEQCHVMVNFDLPWNPMRLVQRIGRLYRYGQTKRVVVFNMHQTDTADEQVLDILYSRLDKVAEDMATVQADEYNERMKDDVIGDLAELLDVGSILQEAAHSNIDRTRENIDEALAAAARSAKLQKDLFQYASSYDPDEVKNELSLTGNHTKALVKGCADLLGIEIIEQSHRGEVWHLRLPEEILDDIGITRSRWAMSFDRAIAARRKEFLYASLDNWLMTYLLDFACQHEPRGVLAITPGIGDQAVLASVARWQTPAGERARQELALFGVTGKRAILNPEWASQWLLEPQARQDAETAINATPDPSRAIVALETAEHRIEQLLRHRSHARMIPDQPQWVAAGWLLKPSIKSTHQ